MNCINCHFYDKNDIVYTYGTCEPQDKDFHCTHECNLNSEQIAELEQLTGHKVGTLEGGAE